MKRLSLIFLSATVISGLSVVAGRGAEQPNASGITDTQIKIGQTKPYSRLHLPKSGRRHQRRGPRLSERSRHPATLPRGRQRQMGRPTTFSLDDGLAAVPPNGRPYRCRIYSPNEARREDRGPGSGGPPGGKDYVAGLEEGLGDRAKTMIVDKLTYQVTDATTDSQIGLLQASGADTFFDISVPKFAAQAIRKLWDMNWKPLHVLTFVSTPVGGTLKPAGLDRRTRPIRNGTAMQA
jgi:hypothetical protein